MCNLKFLTKVALTVILTPTLRLALNWILTLAKLHSAICKLHTLTNCTEYLHHAQNTHTKWKLKLFSRTHNMHRQSAAEAKQSICYHQVYQLWWFTCSAWISAVIYLLVVSISYTIPFKLCKCVHANTLCNLGVCWLDDRYGSSNSEEA